MSRFDYAASSPVSARPSGRSRPQRRRDRSRGARAGALVAAVVLLVAPALAVMGCAKSVRPPPPPSPAEEISVEAALRIQEGRWNTADDLLVDALRRAELSDDLQGQGSAWSNAGVLLMAQGRAEDAVVAHRRAVSCLSAA